MAASKGLNAPGKRIGWRQRRRNIGSFRSERARPQSRGGTNSVPGSQVADDTSEQSQTPRAATHEQPSAFFLRSFRWHHNAALVRTEASVRRARRVC